MKLLSSLLFSFILVSSSQAQPVLKTIQGQAIPFSSLKGQWVFINYWASWCQPCLEEIPELNQFYQAHKKDKQVQLFAVNYDGLPVAAQKQLINQLGISYPSLSNNPARFLKLGDITGVPVTFVFNPKGELSQTLYGPQSADFLQQLIL